MLRHINAQQPNHVWGIDITYIRLKGGWMYLVAILDWFSRFVVTWEVDQTLELPFVLNAVERALQQATPTIWNSDQGSHFTSPQYLNRLLSANVQISMDGRGRAVDNIFTERLWRSVKYEEVYLNDYLSPRGAPLAWRATSTSTTSSDLTRHSITAPLHWPTRLCQRCYTHP